MAPWSGLWGGRPVLAGRDTPVVVRMENPNSWSVSEIDDDDECDDDLLSGRRRRRRRKRGKKAKQITWVLLLKAHRAAGCLAWLASAAVTLGCAARRRVTAGRTDADAEDGAFLPTPTPIPPPPPPPRRSGRFYAFIRALLLLSLLLLAGELAARATGHRRLSATFAAASLGSLHASWTRFRAAYVAPPLQRLADACVALFLIQSADRVAQCLGCLYIRLRRVRPEPISPAAAAAPDVEDPGAGYGYFPMVLVQIPMCNEKEVYQQSIAAACSLDWPTSSLLVQVLDDSDDPVTQALIREEVDTWRRHGGAPVVYRHRGVREGYKAGNLKSAMNCSYVRDYEFVAIFDADFQPHPDFLRRTVPHFKDNEELGLVQARWSFVNKDENLLTRLQNMNLSFHFEVEQQVNGVFINFFGFNGTAGVWRIRALEDSGGWMERTTVARTWTSPSGHISEAGSSSSSMTWSASASCRSRMRLTGSSSTGGIQAQCSSSGCACRTSSEARWRCGRKRT